MRYTSPFTVVRSAVVSVLTNQFARRLTISVLLTGFDGSVIFAVLPTISEAAKHNPGLAAVFAVLGIGLAATLSRTWFLTFRDRSIETVPATLTHWHEERRVP